MASGVLTTLSEFDPVLAGTIPLDIDLPNSDLDILCHARDLAAFKLKVISLFKEAEGFRIREYAIREEPSVIANFFAHGFEFEIFGQDVPVAKQYGYVHMVVEDRLLRIGGENARREIRGLKESGLKTEPSFAKYFAIDGDPYDALYALGTVDEAELRKRFDP